MSAQADIIQSISLTGPTLSGDGIGNGPLRSFWAAVMDLITNRPNHWQQVEDGYYVPVITSLPPSDDDLQAFRAYGLVLRTGLLWGMDLLPISPALICYLVSNYEAATDPAFLKAILPQTFTRLATWPPPLIDDEVTGSPRLNILPAADPYTMILEYDGNISVCRDSVYHSLLITNGYCQDQPASYPFSHSVQCTV